MVRNVVPFSGWDNLKRTPSHRACQEEVIEGQRWAPQTHKRQKGASKNPVWISEGSQKARSGVSVYRAHRNALLVGHPEHINPRVASKSPVWFAEGSQKARSGGSVYKKYTETLSKSEILIFLRVWSFGMHALYKKEPMYQALSEYGFAYGLKTETRQFSTNFSCEPHGKGK